MDLVGIFTVVLILWGQSSGAEDVTKISQVCNLESTNDTIYQFAEKALVNDKRTIRLSNICRSKV